APPVAPPEGDCPSYRARSALNGDCSIHSGNDAAEHPLRELARVPPGGPLGVGIVPRPGDPLRVAPEVVVPGPYDHEVEGGEHVDTLCVVSDGAEARHPLPADHEVLEIGPPVQSIDAAVVLGDRGRCAIDPGARHHMMP